MWRRARRAPLAAESLRRPAATMLRACFPCLRRAIAPAPPDLLRPCLFAAPHAPKADELNSITYDDLDGHITILPDINGTVQISNAILSTVETRSASLPSYEEKSENHKDEASSPGPRTSVRSAASTVGVDSFGSDGPAREHEIDGEPEPAAPDGNEPGAEVEVLSENDDVNFHRSDAENESTAGSERDEPAGDPEPERSVSRSAASFRCLPDDDHPDMEERSPSVRSKPVSTGSRASSFISLGAVSTLTAAGAEPPDLNPSRVGSSRSEPAKSDATSGVSASSVSLHGSPESRNAAASRVSASSVSLHGSPESRNAAASRVSASSVSLYGSPESRNAATSRVSASSVSLHGSPESRNAAALRVSASSMSLHGSPESRGAAASRGPSPGASPKVSPKLSPETDARKPLARPPSRVDVARCLTQLENDDWEKVIAGLRDVERAAVSGVASGSAAWRPAARAVARHVRNLRSQVARAACRALGTLFEVQGRWLEAEADEAAVPLFDRTADTNRFIRADAENALARLSAAVSTARALSVLVSRGSAHRAGAARGACARLLAVVIARAGAGRVLAAPPELRVRVLRAAADLLVDAGPDTRAHAKRLFVVLSEDPKFYVILKDSIPPSKYKCIEKIIKKLRAGG